MKRIAVFFVTIMVFMSSVAVALPMSLGGGLNLGMESINSENIGTADVSWLNVSVDTIGASVFFDVNYACLSVNILQGNYASMGRMPASPPMPTMFNIKQSFSFIDIQLVGKLPISLYGSQTILVFPMVGLGYRLSDMDGGLEFDNDKGGYFDPSFNSLRILFGLGADFNFNENVFLRLSALPYYFFPEKAYRNMVMDDSANKGGLVDLPGGYGINGGLSVGFRFDIPQRSPTGDGRPQRTVPETTSPQTSVPTEEDDFAM